MRRPRFLSKEITSLTEKYDELLGDGAIDPLSKFLRIFSLAGYPPSSCGNDDPVGLQLDVDAGPDEAFGGGLDEVAVIETPGELVGLRRLCLALM